MNTLIIYDSLYGNTRKIAETIAGVLQQYGRTRVLAAVKVTATDFAGIDLLVVGGPTQVHGASPAVKALLETIPPDKLDGLPTVSFDTRIDINRWLSGSAADIIGKKLQQLNAKLFLPPESFFVEGKEGPAKSGEVERAAKWARTIVERMPGLVAIMPTEETAAIS